MIDRLARTWRLIATALSFTAFGVGGLLLGLIWFPLLSLCVRDRRQLAMYARRSIHKLFIVFIGTMRALGVLSYRISGREKLAGEGLLVLANHPTLIDVVFLIALIPNADCVVKASLKKNPFTRGPVTAAAYICNDSGPGLVADCIDSIRRGNTLIIFPEGTRTPLDGKLALRRGAANIAVRGNINVTPVLIRVNQRGLAKGLPWWHIPSKRMHFDIEAREAIDVARFANPAGDAMSARDLTHFLTEYFAMEIPAHAGA